MWWERVVGSLPYLVLVLAFLMLRVLQVFTKHQQKMAEILNRESNDRNEIAALRAEIGELRSMLVTKAEPFDSRETVAQRLAAGK